MLARTGNMRGVYLETHRQEELMIVQAERRMNETVSHTKPLEAEIAHGSTADWYLVYTRPGEDLRAMRWLAHRRFGVFRAMQQRKDRRNGNENVVQGWEPTFPGWLFVFVWDIKKLKARLKVCPGVQEILCDPVTYEPVPIDMPDEHGVRFIEKLRARAEAYNEHAPRLLRHNVRIPTAKRVIRTAPRRPHKLERKALDRLKNELKSRGFNSEHAIWGLANGLEPHLRIALLQRTLSTAPPLTVSISG